MNIEKIRPIKNAFHPDRGFTCHLLLCPTLGTKKEETIFDCIYAQTHQHIVSSQKCTFTLIFSLLMFRALEHVMIEVQIPSSRALHTCLLYETLLMLFSVHKKKGLQFCCKCFRHIQIVSLCNTWCLRQCKTIFVTCFTSVMYFIVKYVRIFTNKTLRCDFASLYIRA